MKKEVKIEGFSLVELLVVVAIILVLMGIGSYTINQFIQNREVTQMRDYLSDQTKLARNLAVTNQLPDGTADLNYVRFWLSGNRLTIMAYKNNSSIYITDAPYFARDLDMDSDISVTITNNGVGTTSFGFLGKSGKLTDSNGALSDGPVVVTVSGVGQTSRFSVSGLGIINNEN